MNYSDGVSSAIQTQIDAKASLSEVDKYANQWASGQISYGEYERKAMASMDYYSN